MKKFIPILTLAAALLAGCGSQIEKNAQAAAPENQPKEESKGLLSRLMPKAEPIVVPAGEPISIRLQNSVSSATATPGDNFDFVLTESLVVNGKTIAPVGAQGIGRV